jgi:TolB-like protein/Tfp pilus assembly protein PilF
VVQWGIAYVAAAWVLLQGIDFLADAFHWPDAAKQIATLVLLVGLPVVLVLAWFHGDRGEQRAGATEIGIIAVLLLGGGTLLWLYDPTDEAPASAAVTDTPSATAKAVGDPRPSIAVLPFDNRSREADDAFFVDGIHDDILTQLTKVGALKVIARTSVEQFRDTRLTTREIGERLGVTKVLEGGVQRAGDRVHVTVQLIDAATHTHLWAESYDRELTAANIFAIQSEVAAAIADALKASLTASEQVRMDAIPTEDLEAWQAYQIGKQRMAKRTSAGLAEAEQFFQRAIDRDPKFALAYVGLADTVRLQVNYSGKPRDPSFTQAEALIARALTLAPDLPEAIATSATLAYYRGDYKRSEAEFQRSIALNPNYSNAYLWYGELLSAIGRTKEAVRQTQIGLELDPISAILNSTLGGNFAQLGRFDEALMQFRKVIEIDPTMPNPYRAIGEVYAFGLGQLDAAMPWLEKAASLDPSNPVLPTILADLYLDLGDETQAQRWLDLALEHGAQSAYVQSSAAVFALYRDDHDAFLTHARTMAALNPRQIWLLRDADLRGGDYAVARARYAKAFPALFATELPPIRSLYDALAAIELAVVLQHAGEKDRAKALLDRSEAFIRTIPRMGDGYGIADVAIHTLRGETATALAKLREAVDFGWSYGWRYYRDFDPNLASIRSAPEFKAVFADIARDMAEQRARLAARPKDAPLELGDGY